MTRVVLGIFDNRHDADMAIDDLLNSDYKTQDISVIMRSEEGKEEVEGRDIVGGAVTGATAGGVIGSVAGLLIGIGAIAIPGIGAILIGGPIAAALGLVGAAATTVSGAITGALAGGLVGALVSLGVPEERARRYESRIREGGILVVVPVSDDNESEVKDILERHGVDDLVITSLKF